MVVGDHQLHPRRVPGDEASEEGEPAGPVLRRCDLEAEDFPVPVAVDRGGDQAGDVGDPAALADLHRQGVGPQIGVGASVEGPVAEVGRLLVEVSSQLGDLRLRPRGDPQGLDQAGDPPGGDPPHVGFGHHLDEGPLRPSPSVQQPNGGNTSLP